MKRKSLRQTEVAKQCGISKSYLSMILSGQRNCPPELEKRIRSQIPVNSVAKLCLEGRNSTTELLPQSQIYFTRNAGLGKPALSVAM